MQKIQYRVALSDDRQTVRIETAVDGELTSSGASEACEISGLINLLMANRAKMADEVARDLDPGSIIPEITDPIWKSQRQADGSVAIAVRHPGFGWLSLLLPKASAEHLSRSIASEGQAI
jgi:hypothetical protein